MKCVSVNLLQQLTAGWTSFSLLQHPALCKSHRHVGIENDVAFPLCGISPVAALTSSFLPTSYAHLHDQALEEITDWWSWSHGLCCKLLTCIPTEQMAFPDLLTQRKHYLLCIMALTLPFIPHSKKEHKDLLLEVLFMIFSTKPFCDWKFETNEFESNYSWLTRKRAIAVKVWAKIVIILWIHGTA